jgi:hypothetical protein
VAALGAPPLDQRPPLTGSHPATEPVFALTAAVIRLIRAFHGEVSLVGEVAVNPSKHGTHAF